MRLLFYFLLINISLSAQAQFSLNFDAGIPDQYNYIKTCELNEDTFYYISFNACNLTDSSFTMCSVVGKMDLDGDVLVEKTFEWLDPEKKYKTFIVEEDSLIVASGLSQGDENFVRLLYLDKENLDSLKAYNYAVNSQLDFSAVTSLIQYDDYFIVTGWSGPGENFPEWMLWINRHTMEIEDRLELPIQNDGALFQKLFVDENNLLTCYYSIARNPIWYYKGFVKYNTDREVVFEYIDLEEFRTPFQYVHAPLLMSNGDMLYKQILDKNALPENVTNSADYEVKCVDEEGNFKWRFNNPGSNPYGDKDIFSFTETADGDIIGCGRTRGIFNFDDGFEYITGSNDSISFPDDPQVFEAPYIIKLNGETGELIWQHELIEFDNNGNVAPLSLSEIYELPDGSLMAGGSYAVRDEEGRQQRLKSWVVRLDSDGCYFDGCGFESFLSNTEEIEKKENDSRQYSIYPNPVNNFINISGPSNIKKIELISSSGKIIKRWTTLYSKVELDVRGIKSGFYVISITDKFGAVELSKLIID